MIPYQQINDVANGSREVRAFIFERHNEWYVVYWHISANKRLELPLRKSAVKLYKNLSKEEKIQTQNNSIVVPVGDRHYLKAPKASKEELVNAFRNARIIE